MVPWEVMKHITFNDITQHLQGNKVIEPSQHGFKVANLVDEANFTDVVYLNTYLPQHPPGEIGCL